MTHILVVEDEVRIAEFIERGLVAAGYTVTAVDSGRAGVQAALTGSYDLVILDLGLPDLDGFEVLEEIRGSGSPIPVIILTARDDVRTTVTGLRQGANDYMVKPFQFAELEARVELRLSEARGGTAAEAAPSLLVVGDVTLDLRTRRLQVAAVAHDLTAREFHLAETFLRQPGVVLSREELLNRVWGYDFAPGSNVVDVYVRHLRAKIGRARITTVRGAGYRFDPRA